MPPSTLLCNDELANNWFEAKWLASTKTRFFELSKTALKWPPVSDTFCYAGVDPAKLINMTHGSNGELDKALHNIYTGHGPVELQIRGCDLGGSYYIKCSLPGNKYGPANAVICVSRAKKEKETRAAAKTEPSRLAVDAKMQIREDWEDVVIGEVEVEDDWVRI